MPPPAWGGIAWRMIQRDVRRRRLTRAGAALAVALGAFLVLWPAYTAAWKLGEIAAGSRSMTALISLYFPDSGFPRGAAPPTVPRKPDCAVARVRLRTEPTVSAAEGRGHIPPVLLWATYLDRAGHPIKTALCPPRYRPPQWEVHGDERGVLVVSVWPYAAELHGPPGTAYTVRAVEPTTGQSAAVDVAMAGGREAGRGPRVVRKPKVRR